MTGWQVVGSVGYKRTFTEAEKAQIDLERAEMRERLLRDGCDDETWERIRGLFIAKPPEAA